MALGTWDRSGVLEELLQKLTQVPASSGPNCLLQGDSRENASLDRVCVLRRYALLKRQEHPFRRSS